MGKVRSEKGPGLNIKDVAVRGARPLESTELLPPSHCLGISRGAPSVKTGQSRHSEALQKALGWGVGTLCRRCFLPEDKAGAPCLDAKSVGTSWPRPLPLAGCSCLCGQNTSQGPQPYARCGVAMDPERLLTGHLWDPYLPADTGQEKGKTQAVQPGCKAQFALPPTPLFLRLRPSHRCCARPGEPAALTGASRGDEGAGRGSAPPSPPPRPFPSRSLLPRRGGPDPAAAGLHFPPCSAAGRAGFRWRVVSGADRNPESGSDPGLAIPQAGNAGSPRSRPPRTPHSFPTHPRPTRGTLRAGPPPRRLRARPGPTRLLSPPRRSPGRAGPRRWRRRGLPGAAAAAAAPPPPPRPPPPPPPPCRLFFVTAAAPRRAEGGR